MPAPHIVHFSSVHRAQDTRILHRECRSLVDAGYRVTLIANAEKDFEEHGVKVRALPARAGGRLSRMTRHAWNAWRMAAREDADLYHFHDPELIPAGIALRLRGKPVIYDVHESVSKQIRSKMWIPSPVRRVVARAYRLMERAIAPVMTAFVAATPGVASYFPAGKTIVVQNYPIIDELRPESSSTAISREALAAYVGGITEVRGAHEMVAAMNLMPPGADIRLEIAGPVASESLRKEMETAPGFDRVRFLGMLNRSEVGDLLARASVGLVVLHPEPNYIDSYPVKLFEYMAAGVPVVASNFPFWKQFVEDVGSGVMVDPLNPQSIADGILEIINDPERAQQMGEAGAKAVRERFNWDTEAEKLIGLVGALTGREDNGKQSAYGD